MMNMTTNQKMKRSLGRAVRGAMVAMLLVSYLPVNLLGASPLATAVTGDPAAAPVISKNIDHTSLYIQSDATYQRGVREYVTAASPDGGVLTYAWFINKTDAYLDGSDNATSGTFGDNGEGEGNSDYIGSYGSQSASSNILIATTPTEVGKYYTYVEITNTLENGDSQTIRSKRTTLDVRSGDKTDKPAQAANVKIAPQFQFPNLTVNVVGSRNTTLFGAFDSTLFYCKRSLRTSTPANVFGNYINFDLQQVHTTPAAGSEIGIAMETKTLSGGRTVLDTFCVGQSSVFQDISTVPGAIYDVNFDHVSIDTGQNNDVDVLAATIAPSKFSADDYPSDVPNRYWDGSSGINSAQGLNNDQTNFYFNLANDTNNLFRGTKDLTTVNVGKYPYGLNPASENLGAGSDNVVQNGISGNYYGTDYFFDLTRYALFGLYKGDSQQVYQYDKANAVNDNLNRTAIRATIINPENANKKKAFTYGGQGIVQFYSRDNLAQEGQTNVNKKQFYYTVPEGQGATVEAFTSLSTSSVASDNGIDNVQFKRIAKPNINLSQSYSGANSLTVTTKADYAYALIDVSFGYSQLIPNVGQYTTATIDPSLGKGNNWFTTTNSKITFTGLAQGATYRIIAIPKAAIQLETESNVTPLDVIDTDAWVDTTIGIADDEGQVLAGAYKNAAGETKGRVMLRQASTINDYALLAVDGNGRPMTDTPVAVWTAPNAAGELEFDELDLLAGDNHYVVITKPQAFFHFDYAKATYSPTEVYRTGDTIPPGFALDEPVMVGAPVTITHKQGYQALGISELTRTLGTATDADNNAATDTLTISYDALYRGGTTFPANTKAIAFDKATGTVAAPVFSVDVSGKTGGTLNVPAGKDWEVILKFGDHHDLPILALSAPEPLEIDYVNETLLTAGKTGAEAYNTQGNLDYQLKSDGHYYLGSSATTTVQGSNTQPINLTPALDDANHPYDTEGSLTYTKHIADATRTIATQRTLAVPKRPDALTMGNGTGQVQVDYPNETEVNATGQVVLLSSTQFVTLPIEATAGADTAFAAFGWTGNAAVVVSSRTAAIAGTAFKGKISDKTVVQRPDAPTLGTSEGVMTQATQDTITFENTYGSRTLGVSGLDVDGNGLSGLPVTIAPSTAHTATGHSDDNSYEIIFTATTDAPRSKVLDFSTSVFAVEAVDFGDIIYGTLGPDLATTYPNIGVGTSQPAGNEFPASVHKKALSLKNTGDRAYWLDVQYVDPTAPTPVMKFDNQGLFAFTGADNLPDNYGGGGLQLGSVRQLLGQNIIDKKADNSDLNIILGNVSATGNWTPDLTSATGNTTGNINTAPIGLYKTRLYMAYSDYIDGASTSDASDDVTAQDVLDDPSKQPSDPAHALLKNPSYFSALVQVNIVKAQWDKPIVATQASQATFGQDTEKLRYVITENSIGFDVVLDAEVDSAHLMISTDGGMSWFAPGFFNLPGSSYELQPGQMVRRVNLTQSSAGETIRPASTYDIRLKVVDDTNHTESETALATFWTQAATPTDKHLFVNYFTETLSFNSDYEVQHAGQVQQSGDSVTALFEAPPYPPQFTLTVMVKAKDNYPASNVATFTYDREAKPELDVTDETVYYTGTGAITSRTGDAIQVRNDGATYDGSVGVDKKNLFTGVFHVRRPATATNFASEEVKVLLLPATYNVRVKVGASSDPSIGATGYSFEPAGSYLKKDTPQAYTQAFTDATFSRTGYVSQPSQVLPSGAQAFTAGTGSLVEDDKDAGSIAAFDAAVTNLANFKTNLDDTHALARQIIWGDLAGTYTVEIPAQMTWDEVDDGLTSQAATITIDAWDAVANQSGIASDSELSVKIAADNVRSLINTSAPMFPLTYSLAREGETTEIANGDVIHALAGTAVTDQPVTQDFRATVTAPPRVAGTYQGTLTFEVSLRKVTP